MRILRTEHIAGWRRGQKLAGSPDFVFPKLLLCVFLDGCFWHGCPTCYRRPASNRDYWDGKVLRNRRRDRAVNRSLRADGWRVLRIWEHELKNANRTKLRARLRRAGLVSKGKSIEG